MKIVLAALLALVAVILGVAAYEVRRSTWSPEDQACYSPLSDKTTDENCRIRWHNDQWKKANFPDPLG